MGTPSMSAMASRDLRALVLGAAVVAVATVVGRGIPALDAWAGQQQQRATRTAISLADARALVGAAVALGESARLGRARLSSLDSAFIAGNSVSRGAANLASELSENAEVVGIKVEALQADSLADVTSPVRRVRVR